MTVSGLMTIEELAERAAVILDGTGTAPASRRVSAVPDRRMLRYYTTLGLLDRPQELRGRVGYYGRRHLLQVVAIKRLQAEGASLREIQRRLAGLPTPALGRLARVDEKELAGGTVAASAGPPAGPTGRGAFWAAAPAAGPPVAGQPAPPAPEVLSAVPLAPGVTLLLATGRQLTAEDARGLEAAAAGLLAHLHTSGLLREDARPKEG